MISEAQHRRSQREDALLGLPARLVDEAGAVFGPRVVPLTPWRHLLLLGHANACFCGGERDLDAVLQYLWLCSPGLHYGARGSSLRFALFAWRWQFSMGERRRSAPSGPGGRVPTQRALRAIERHTEALLLDRPARVVKKDDVPAEPLHEQDGPHELASFELLCRRQLNYTRAEFWHTPYAHTNQLLAVALGHRDPKAPKFNRSRDRAAKAWLAKYKASLRAGLR